MPYTYPSGGGSSSNPPYSMLTPIDVLTNPALYQPRVAVNNQGQQLSQGGALPYVFKNDTIIDGVYSQYNGNQPRDGFTNNNGQKGINPGWQIRCLVFNADSTTGLPTTLRDNLGMQTIANLNDGGQNQGLFGWEYSQTIPANTPIWILIAGQPIWQESLPDGFFDGYAYSWDGSAWVHDEENGGFLTSPITPGWTTELDPVVSLPLLEMETFAFGNLPIKLNIQSQWGPMYDIAQIAPPGAPHALNIADDANLPSVWLPAHDFITNNDFNYVGMSQGTIPMIQAHKA